MKAVSFLVSVFIILKVMNAYSRLYLGVVLKSVLIVVVPPAIFLMVVMALFSFDETWQRLLFIAAEFAAWIGFVTIGAQLLGSSLPHLTGWDILKVLRAFDNITRRSLLGAQNRILVIGQLERDEVKEVWKHLEEGHSVLLDGQSGTGKSGIASEIVKIANHRKTPVLFLNARNYSSTVGQSGDLSHYVEVARPLRECLDEITKSIGDCLIVIDQLDSVVGSPAYQASVELLASAKAIKGIRAVAVSSSFESVEYQSMRELGFEIVHSRSLASQYAIKLLNKLGIANPSDALVSLSENLFYLSLVAELAGKVDISQLAGKVALLDNYQTALEKAEGPEVLQAAIDLAYENLDASKKDFPLPRVHNRAAQRLRSRGIIIPVARNLFRFRHEQLLYYFFAVGAVDREISPKAIIERLAGQYAVSALVWILRVYYQRRSHTLPDYLREALLKQNPLGFFEQAALLDEILKWPDIADQKLALEVILEMLRTVDGLRKHFFRSHPGAEWAPILWEHGFFDSPPPPEKTDQGYMLGYWDVQSYLASVAPQVPEIVVKHAETIRGHGWYISRAIEALCKIPPEKAQSVVPRIVGWLRDAQVAQTISHESSELMIVLAKNNHIDSALTLFDALTSPDLTSEVDVEGARATAHIEAGRAYNRMLGTKFIVDPIVKTQK